MHLGHKIANANYAIKVHTSQIVEKAVALIADSENLIVDLDLLLARNAHLDITQMAQKTQNVLSVRLVISKNLVEKEVVSLVG